MRVRIVVTPIVEEARAKHVPVGSIHETVGEVFAHYSKEKYPSTPCEGNLTRQGDRPVVRHVFINLNGERFVLLQHEYQEHKSDPLPLPAGATDDEGERTRVSERIEAAILEFAKRYAGKQFHAELLRKHVRERCGEVAPGSPDRILRSLRKSEKLSYRVVSRAESLYEIVSVA